MAPKTRSAKKPGRKKAVASTLIGKRSSLPVPTDYVSPLKKRREAQRQVAAQKTERIIATAQELRAYAKEPKRGNEVVCIYGVFLWASYHVTKHGRNIIHLHFYNAVTDDSVDDLLKAYEYDGERNFDADKELITATVWDQVEGCNGIPRQGEVVRISRFSGLIAFRDETCQFNTNLADLLLDEPGQNELAMMKQGVWVRISKDVPGDAPITKGCRDD